MQSFDFSADDATDGRSFVPIAPIDQPDAEVACQRGIVQRAAHPSTVEFPRARRTFTSDDSGHARLTMVASAKNAFNLQLRLDVTCSFAERKLESVEMSEASVP